MRTLRERDALLEELWKQFGDVPMDPSTETMEAPFLDFPAGTSRVDIWRWFDERHSKGIAYLLYNEDASNAASITSLLHCQKLCTECCSETCVFNSQGICMAPFLTGKKPGVHMMAAPITARSRWMDVSWFAPTPSMSFGAMRRTFGNISHSSPTRSLWKPMSLTARRSMRSPRVRRS